MNLVMKKRLPRRTFLRGAGTALALPLHSRLTDSDIERVAGALTELVSK